MFGVTPKNYLQILVSRKKIEWNHFIRSRTIYPVIHRFMDNHKIIFSMVSAIDRESIFEINCISRYLIAIAVHEKRPVIKAPR